MIDMPWCGLALPIELGGLKEREGTHDIGASKGEGVLDTAVDMTLGCKVDDAIDLLVLHQLIEGIEVTDVHLDKLVVGTVLDILQIGEVAGIGQLVKVDDLILGILVDEQSYYMAADEAGTAGDDDVTHMFFIGCGPLAISFWLVIFFLCYNGKDTDNLQLYK